MAQGLAGGEGRGDAEGGDLGDEGQHRLHSQLGDGHDEGLAGCLQELVQLLLAVHLAMPAPI